MNRDPTMSYLRTLLLSIGLLCTLTLSAEPQPTVTVGYYEFPPLSYTDANGKPQGSGIKLAESMLTELGYNIVFKGLPSARLYAQLIAGEVDLWPGSLGKQELAGHVLESSIYISEATLALFYHPLTPAPQLPDGLQNKKIILISGYSYWPPVTEWLADPKLNITTVRTSKHEAATAMLLRNRGDYLLNYITPMQEAQQQLGMTEIKLPYVSINSMPLTFIISKKSPYASQLLKGLEEASDLASPHPLTEQTP